MDRPALTLVKSDGLPDWFTIEWAVHDHRGWVEEIHDEFGGYLSWCYSGRPADADIEGTSAEMRAIAEAIEKGESAEFRRCAAIKTDQGYQLYSPRNSRTPYEASQEQAAHLAEEIRRVLKEVTDAGSDRSPSE